MSRVCGCRGAAPGGVPVCCSTGGRGLLGARCRSGGAPGLGLRVWGLDKFPISLAGTKYWEEGLKRSGSGFDSAMGKIVTLLLKLLYCTLPYENCPNMRPSIGSRANCGRDRSSLAIPLWPNNDGLMGCRKDVIGSLGRWMKGYLKKTERASTTDI